MKPADDRERFPFYHLVPKDIVANLEFRRAILKYGSRSWENARDVWTMCARDPLFFINTFCWGLDPRHPISKYRVMPFITWEEQDENFAGMAGSIGLEDLFGDKSRCQGGTYGAILIIAWAADFHGHTSALLVSRKEEMVDRAEDPDTLFSKLDQIHQYLPAWLRPPESRVRRNFMHYYNAETQSTIDGTTTTSDLGVGGRRTIIFLDEFATFGDKAWDIWRGTRGTTDCRWPLSTVRGTGNCFHALYQNPGIRKIRYYWRNHPVQSMGLYTAENGTVRIIDTDYWEGRDVESYPFVLDGKYPFRSPWFDNECRRAVSPVEIPQEIEIDYGAAGSPFYPREVLDRIARQDVSDPLMVGDLDYGLADGEPEEFVDRFGGPLRMWLRVAPRRHPPDDRTYVMGVDISQGVGASNSCACVIDAKSGEQVAELVTPDLRPEKFAVYCVALARWFHDAQIIWERHGPGIPFYQQACELGYGNFYFSTDITSRKRKRVEKPGFSPNRGTVMPLHIRHRKALDSGAVIIRSRDVVRECREYRHEKDTVVHSMEVSEIDPAGAKANHGDRCKAHALATWIMPDAPKVEFEMEVRNDMSTLAGRREARRREGERENKWATPVSRWRS